MIMVFWVARDKDGHLYLYDEKPILNGDYFNASTNGHTTHLFNNTLWVEITFENSPQKIKIELTKEN